MKVKKCSSFRYLLPLAVVVACLSFLIYTISQQVLRQSANDPQIQLAEDTALALSQGQTPSLPSHVNIAQSLAPYVIVYDENEKIISTSAALNEETPPIPEGVLAYAKEHGENRVTWQPRPGVRSAIVVRYVSGGAGGYVVAGRSLREVEKREGQLGELVFAGFIGTEIVLLISTLVISFI